MGSNVGEKKIDLPPRGNRNADPITNESGAHPIEAGIGAAVAGVVGGVAVGAVAGPVAAAVGAAVAGVAGGYAGKGLGEMIDPTTQDHWLRDHFASRPYVKEGETFETYVPAYRYGAEAEAKYGDAGIDLLDEQFQREWEASKESDLPWTRARAAIHDAYDRTVQLRRARECPATGDEVQED